MDMLPTAQIAEERLTDWRKLAQGLHARFLVDDFASGAGFVAAVGESDDEVGHHLRAVVGRGHVDLELVTPDAVYREDDGTEHVVEWVTPADVDLARRISDIAAERGLRADPSAVAEVELGLETAGSATIAPVWAALLTGSPDSQGRGSPGDEVRDASARVPNLWFDDLGAGAAAGQKVHLEVYLPHEVLDERVAAAVAAGATVVDDSDAPGLTVLADQEGNRAILCVAMPDPAGD